MKIFEPNWIFIRWIFIRAIFDGAKAILIKVPCKSTEKEREGSDIPPPPNLKLSRPTRTGSATIFEDVALPERANASSGKIAPLADGGGGSQREPNRREWLAAAKCGRGLSRRSLAGTIVGRLRLCSCPVGLIIPTGAGAISPPWRSKMAAACRRRLRSHSARRRAVRVRSQQRFSRLTRRRRQIERRIARDRGIALPLRAWDTVPASGDAMSRIPTPL